MGVRAQRLSQKATRQNRTKSELVKDRRLRVNGIFVDLLGQAPGRRKQHRTVGVRPAKKTMTDVPQLEQNRQVYSVEGADAVIESVLPLTEPRLPRLVGKRPPPSPAADRNMLGLSAPPT